MAFVFRLRSKIKVAHCKFSDLESILYFWPRGSLDAIYLREGSIPRTPIEAEVIIYARNPCLSEQLHNTINSTHQLRPAHAPTLPYTLLHNLSCRRARL